MVLVVLIPCEVSLGIRTGSCMALGPGGTPLLYWCCGVLSHCAWPQ